MAFARKQKRDSHSAFILFEAKGSGDPWRNFFRVRYERANISLMPGNGIF